LVPTLKPTKIKTNPLNIPNTTLIYFSFEKPRYMQTQPNKTRNHTDFTSAVGAPVGANVVVVVARLLLLEVELLLLLLLLYALLVVDPMLITLLLLELLLLEVNIVVIRDAMLLLLELLDVLLLLLLDNSLLDVEAR